MSGYLLIIDDIGNQSELVSPAAAALDLRVITVKDFASAKRRLVQEAPEIIVTKLSFEHDPQAGIEFCRQLQSHPELSLIPVVLFADNAEDLSGNQAADSGAKAIVDWSVGEEGMRAALLSILPHLVPSDRDKPLPKEAPESGAVRATTPTEPKKPAAISNELGRKLEAAQKLLAQVLHSLKTSDLLQIAELDDVPRIVLEMTRKVCLETGKTQTSVSGIQQPGGPTQAQSSDRATEMDLERAFKLKS